MAASYMGNMGLREIKSDADALDLASCADHSKRLVNVYAKISKKLVKNVSDVILTGVGDDVPLGNDQMDCATIGKKVQKQLVEENTDNNEEEDNNDGNDKDNNDDR